jgi:hypothetical protein
MMVFTYLLGRLDTQGRTLVEADQRSTIALSIPAFIVIGHAVYLSVFAPHLATRCGPGERRTDRQRVPNRPKKCRGSMSSKPEQPSGNPL